MPVGLLLLWWRRWSRHQEPARWGPNQASVVPVPPATKVLLAPKCSEWHHQSEEKVMICTKLSDSVPFFSEWKWKWKSDGWPFKAIWRRRRLASGKMQKWSLVALVGGLWKSPVMPRVEWVLLFRGFVSLKQPSGCNLIATRRGRSQFQFSERSRVFSENQAQLWLKYKRALTTNQLWLKQKGWGWLCDFNRNGFNWEGRNISERCFYTWQFILGIVFICYNDDDDDDYLLTIITMLVMTMGGGCIVIHHWRTTRQESACFGEDSSLPSKHHQLSLPANNNVK